MSTRGDVDRIELLQGTLDLLVLRTLLPGPAHGHAIARNDEGVSENNRRARFYRLTPKGRKQLSVETTRWETLARAITCILRAAGQEGRS